jgi:Tol biopolymer transport system component
MDGTSINTTTFTLTVGGTPVAVASVDYDATTKTATLTPADDLVSDTEYRATISSAVENTSGTMPLTNDYVWSFAVSPNTYLVSKNEDGVVGGLSSLESDIDGIGRYVVFKSNAANLVPGISNAGFFQIYRKDTVTGEIRLVSSDDSGLVAANTASSSPRISDGGRFVVFESKATNLSTIASGGFSQIYLKDLADGSVDMISRNSSLTAGNGNSFNPDVSADGKYIVFDSSATNLGGTGFRHVYLVDTADLDTIELISVDSSGVPGNGNSSDPSVSDDGQRIAFVSDAKNLDADNNTFIDVFLRDRNSNGTTSLVSENISATGGGDRDSTNADISGDGNYVVFESNATNLVTDQSTFVDIYVRNIESPSTSLVNFIASGPVYADNNSQNPSINSDGSFVAFESEATNLDTGTFNKSNIFVRDVTTPDDIKRLSLISDVNSNNARISSDGRYVSFDSPYSFTLDDTNNGLVDTYRSHNSTF